MLRRIYSGSSDSSDSSNSSDSSDSSDGDHPCHKNPQRRTFSDDDSACCFLRNRCTHRKCCFCGEIDTSIVEPRGPHKLYSMSQLLKYRSVSSEERRNRKKQLRDKNKEELKSKYGDSIRYGGRYGPQVLDIRSGLWRHFNDRGRTGKKGETWIDSTSKNEEKIRSRCPKTCKICHGCSPGCFLQKRDEERRKITEKYQSELQTLKSKNALLLRKIYMIRMLSFVKHQISTMSRMFQNYRFPVEIVSNQNQGFSLYDTGKIVKKKNFRYKEVIRLGFQNDIDLWKNSTWRHEKKCVIVSARQKRRQLCAGGLSKLLLGKLIPNLLSFFRTDILKKLFRNSSIRRLIMTGQLNWEGFVDDLDLPS